jgi:hypothetical protein
MNEIFYFYHIKKCFMIGREGTGLILHGKGRMSCNIVPKDGNVFCATRNKTTFVV